MKIDVKRIRAEMARQQKGSAAMCATTGLSKAGFAQVLRHGSCRPETAGKIAEALGIDPYEIVLD